jgi:hypothetical protein
MQYPFEREQEKGTTPICKVREQIQIAVCVESPWSLGSLGTAERRAAHLEEEQLEGQESRRRLAVRAYLYFIRK